MLSTTAAARRAASTSRHTAAVVALGVALGGCTAVGGLFDREPSASAAPTQDPSLQRDFQAERLADYLETMRDLIEGDAVTKADVFSNAADAAEYSPTTTNQLNFALALATPGHASSDAAEAQRRLNELLASTSLLPEERVLATIHLKEVEQRLILDAEAQQLQQEAELAIAQRDAETAQRLQATLEENRRLRLELDEAQDKLDAITNIERSIRERENGPN
jgi:hypothetical protein